MSDNLPAVRRVEPDTDSWIAVVQPVGHLAEQIARTEFVPKGLRGSAPATAAAILYGREIGFGPMTSLASIAVIEGRPAVSAEMLRAMVLAAGHDITYTELSGAKVVVQGKRSNSDHWTTVEWNLDMARAAGLLGKDNWKKYPRAMLVARATAELCRLIFPDVTHGLHATEEFEAGAGAETAPTGPAPSTTTKVQRRPRRATAHPPISQSGDEAAGVPGPPAVPPPSRPAEPPLAASSPQVPPLPGEPGYDVTSPSQPESPDPDAHGSGGGGTVVGADGEVLEGPGDSTGASTQGEPAAAPHAAPGPSAPTTQTPALAQTADGASPIAGEQDGEEGAPGGRPAAPSEPPPEDEDRPRMMSKGAQRAMFAAFNSLGVTDDTARLYATSAIVGHQVKSSNDLTAAEGKTLLDTLAKVESREQLVALVNATGGSDG